MKIKEETENLWTWNFRPKETDKRAKGLMWTCYYGEDIVPTGRWRVTGREDDVKYVKYSLDIEIKYTLISKGTRPTKEPSSHWFFRMIGMKDTVDKKEAWWKYGEVTWVNESQIGYRKVSTFTCTCTGEE